MRDSTLSPSSLSALDGSEWSTPRPGCFTPGQDPVRTVWGAGWAPRPFWTGAKNFATTRLRPPDRAARSESLLYVNCLSCWWVTSFSLGTFRDRILLDHDLFHILPNSMLNCHRIIGCIGCHRKRS